MSSSLLPIVQNLARWYAQNAREMPWREPQNIRDPYRVLVSEIMLQQTTVATVTPRYIAFLKRFPSAKVLSRASIDEVLAQWEGLGYYRRARNLHAAAQEIETKYHGVFPRDFEKVLSLPGVGRYTAGAVCSLAYDMPVAALDVNAIRVLARIFAVDKPVKSTFTQKNLWDLGTQLVEAATQNDIPPSQWTSALIELGGTICTKRNPQCERCPVQKYCKAFAEGLQNELPRTAPKRKSIERHDVCLFITKTTENGATKVLLQQCAAGQWWQGMWQLPRAVITQNQTSRATAKSLLQSDLKIDGTIATHLKTMRHTVTHHKIRLDCFSVNLVSAPNEWGNKSTLAWCDSDEIAALAMPSVMRKLINALLSNDQLQLRL